MTDRRGLTPARLALTLGIISVGVVVQVLQVRDGALTSFVVTDALVGVAFVVGGLGAWWLAPRPTLGTASMLGALAWQMGTLAILTDDRAITYGFFAASGYHDVAIAALLLAYASGRLVGRAPRIVLALIVGTYLVGSLVRLTMFDPAGAGCPDCPENPLSLGVAMDTFVDVQDTIGRALGVLFLVVAILTARRWLTRSVPARRAAGVLPFAGAVWALLFLQDTWLRPVGDLLIDDPTAFYVLATARAAVPLGVLSGLIWMRIRQARLAELFTGFGAEPRKERLEPLLRSVLGDPELEVWWPSGEGGWLRADAAGEAHDVVEVDRHRVVTPMTNADGAVIGHLRHDASLLDDDRFAAAVVAVVNLIADHERLTDQVRAQLEEVRMSRARLLTAAAAERERIERDLHDGLQQRLVGLALQLRMARAAAVVDPPDAVAARLDDVAGQLSEAITELRELARGIHPAALTDGGLTAALPLLADRVPIPTAMRFETEARYPPAIEATLYFVASEALANAAKHAEASACSIELRADGGDVLLKVGDDGVGGAVHRAGGGLRGLQDRLDALGGELRIDSRPGTGTVLEARLPVDGVGRGFA